MRNILVLCTVFFCVYLALADPVVTEKHRDVCGSVALNQTNVLTRVDKKAMVTYSFALPKGGWTQFPDLALAFYIPFPQYVSIRYNIQVASAGTGYFCTRIMINGQQNIQFRQTTGDTRHHSNSYQDQVWFQKGNHNVILEYAQNVGVTNSYSEWNINLLKVRFYQD